jgi:hypothetical protein
MTEKSSELLSKPYSKLSTADRQAVGETYRLLVEMADRVSARRQRANGFYLSINAALIGATSYLDIIGKSTLNPALVALVGVAVAILWRRNVDSYRDLNSGKFHVITELEKSLPVAPYTAEWEYLERGKNKSRYRPFHSVEGLVPYVFMTLHLVQLGRLIPWQTWHEYLLHWC